MQIKAIRKERKGPNETTCTLAAAVIKVSTARARADSEMSLWNICTLEFLRLDFFQFFIQNYQVVIAQWLAWGLATR